MQKSKIEWTDDTWNPITGCYHNCEYCYARKMATRFGAGDGKPDERRLHVLDEPVSMNRERGNGNKEERIETYPFDFDPTFHRYRLDEPKRQAVPKTIFVCSMADLFGQWIPTEWIDEVMKAADEAPQHRYLFLTKNPFRYNFYRIPKDDNKWYGTTITGLGSVTNAKMIGAENRFLSIEPLLGDLSMEDWPEDYFSGCKWIIIGAETGTRKGKAKPHKEWIEKIVRQADKNGAAVFMKDSLIPVVGKRGMRREFPW